MKRVLVKIALILLTLAVFSGLVLVLIPQFKPAGNNGRDEETDSSSEENPVDYAKEVSELKQSAWIPYWDFDRGYNSLVKNKDKFESVSPVWYEANKDGTLKILKRDSHKKLETFCKQNGILLIPP